MLALTLIIIGILLHLVVNGKIPKNPSKPVKLQELRKKFELPLKITSAFCVSYGLLDFIGYWQ